MKADREIYDYLLGSLPAERAEEIEQRILADNDFHQEVEIAEDELLDLYCQRGLSTEDRRRFESHFLASPLRRQRLLFAQSLQKKISSEMNGPAPALPKNRNYFYPYAFAASLLVTAFLGFEAYRFSRQAEAERTNVARLQEQVDEMRQQTAVIVPNAIIQASLSPRASRGGPSQPIHISGAALVVQFTLVVPENLHGNVTVDLLNDADEVIITQKGIAPATGEHGNMVRVPFSSQSLKSGNYSLKVTSDDQAVGSFKYPFQVRRNQ